jgi:predicted nuclease of predicted toxin-antitoxin system
VKFLADVNVSRQVVARLRAEGFDVVRVPEIMDGRSPDEEIVHEARRRNAVVISHDQDFTSLLATTGATTPSLINIRVSYVDIGRLSNTIAAVIRKTSQELESGAIVTVNDAGVRVHRLPVGRIP